MFYLVGLSLYWQSFRIIFLPEGGKNQDGNEEREKGDGVTHQFKRSTCVQNPHLQLPRLFCTKRQILDKVPHQLMGSEQCCHFPRKKLFRETGTNRDLDSFRQNSVCFAEQKTEFRPEPFRGRLKKSLEFRSEPFGRRKNTRNFVILFLTISQKITKALISIPNQFTEEKNTRIFILNH